MPPPAQNEAIVSGLVQTRNSVNGNINIAPGHGVLVNWYRRDVTGDGLPDIVSGGPVLTNSSGVYESHYVGADVVQVSVAGRVCTLPDTPDCCLDPLPCGDPTCTVLWGPTRTLAVTPGSRVQQNLTIGCP